MELVTDQHGRSVMVVASGTVQKVSYSGTAGTIGNAVSRKAKVVRVVATTSCYIAFGSNPTATANDIYLPADVVEYWQIQPEHKVSAIQVSSAGVLHVMECK